MVIHWLLYLLLLAILLAGLFINIMIMPGLWVMLIGAIAYSVLTRFHYLHAGVLIILFLLALVGEAVELMLGAGSTRKAGGGRLSLIGAIVGGLLGGILLSLPVPILGTIIGVCAGSFLGAGGIEFLAGHSAEHSVRVGVGAAKGRFLGIMGKLSIGFIMLILTLWYALPIGGATPVAVAAKPTTAPTTATTSPINH